jgi:hypothetical protein
MPLTCGKTLLNLTVMSAVCWLDCADTRLGFGVTLFTLA